MPEHLVVSPVERLGIELQRDRSRGYPLLTFEAQFQEASVVLGQLANGGLERRLDASGLPEPFGLIQRIDTDGPDRFMGRLDRYHAHSQPCRQGLGHGLERGGWRCAAFALDDLHRLLACGRHDG